MQEDQVGKIIHYIQTYLPSLEGILHGVQPPLDVDIDSRHEKIVLEELNWAIKSTPLAACLVSPYRYVREYKKLSTRENI